MSKKVTGKKSELTVVRGIPAGFPSPANDFVQSTIDLNQELVEHPAATYYVQVEGHSMIGAGINTGDLLVVDRSKEFEENSIVVAVIDGCFTVKRIRKIAGVYNLVAENTDFKEIPLREGMDVEIWGVVTYVIHKV
jgi:DNA polymerase V